MLTQKEERELLIPAEFKTLHGMFEAEGKELYLVGGSVRDLLLGCTPHDVDLATNAVPEEIISILKKNGMKVIPIGVEFGTVATIVDGRQVEITTYRTSESYTKGSRKPRVKFGTSLEEDLSRRDFTINAMAMSADGKVIDPFNGERDLRERILDTPSDPESLFEDDPLRILRAARFIARYDMTCRRRVVIAALQKRNALLNLSAERVYDELTKLLMSMDPTDGLDFLAMIGTFEVLIPELHRCYTFNKSQGSYHSKPLWPHILGVVNTTPHDSIVRWAALLHDIAKPLTYTYENGEVHFYKHEILSARIAKDILARLKASNEVQEKVSLLVYLHMRLNIADNPRGRSLRRLYRDLGYDKGMVQRLFELSMADITSSRPDRVAKRIAHVMEVREQMEKVIANTDIAKVKLPKGFGNQLAERGVPKNHIMGTIMKKLTDMLVDGEVTLEDDLIEIGMKMFEEMNLQTWSESQMGDPRRSRSPGGESRRGKLRRS